MVDLIPLRPLYKYETLARHDGSEGRTYGDQKLPSVTRILNETKDKAGLEEWKQRVGEEEAERIRNNAGAVGTYMHSVIERMVAFRDLGRPTNWEMIKGYEMGYRLINEQFKDIDEIWGSEVTLFIPDRAD